MCYHKTFIYTLCGHSLALHTPLTTRCPPCPSQTTNVFSTPTLSSPITYSPSGLHLDALPSAWELEVSQLIPEPVPHVRPSVAISPGDTVDIKANKTISPCTTQLTHPLHIYRIHTLCLRCSTARERRLARFEAQAIKSDLDREFMHRRRQSTVRQQQQVKKSTTSPKTGIGLRVNVTKSMPMRSRSSDTGVEGPEGTTSLKTFGLGKVRDGLTGWTSPLTATTTTPKTVSWLPHSSASWSNGTDTVPLNRNAKLSTSWLSSPRVRNPLNLSLARNRGARTGRSPDEQEVLSPEHFTVTALLHDSRESLTTEEGASRRESRDVEEDGGG